MTWESEPGRYKPSTGFVLPPRSVLGRGCHGQGMGLVQATLKLRHSPKGLIPKSCLLMILRTRATRISSRRQVATSKFTCLYIFLLHICKGIDFNLSQFLLWKTDLTEAVIPWAFVVGKGQSTEKYLSKGFRKVLLPQQWAIAELWLVVLWRALGWEVVKAEIMCLWDYVVLCVYGTYFCPRCLVHPCDDVENERTLTHLGWLLWVGSDEGW